MRLVAQKFPQLPPETILRLGTLNAARALGLDWDLGSLEPGKWANLAVLSLPENTTDNPLRAIFQSESSVIATWERGRKAFDISEMR